MKQPVFKSRKALRFSGIKKSRLKTIIFLVVSVFLIVVGVIFANQELGLFDNRNQATLTCDGWLSESACPTETCTWNRSARATCSDLSVEQCQSLSKGGCKVETIEVTKYVNMGTDNVLKRNCRDIPINQCGEYSGCQVKTSKRLFSGKTRSICVGATKDIRVAVTSPNDAQKKCAGNWQGYSAKCVDKRLASPNQQDDHGNIYP